MFKINLNYTIVSIYASSITFYLAKITSLSPIYLVYIFLTIPSFFILLNNRFVFLKKDIKIALIFLLYIILFNFNNFDNGTFINIFISFISYVVIRLIGANIDLKEYIAIFNKMLILSLLVLTIDTIYRITHPGHPNKEVVNFLSNSNTEWFYLYKFNSFIFADSNTTGLILLILFFSVITISNINNTFNYFYIKVFIVLLLFLTFSRSAIFSLMIGYLSINYHNLKNKYKLQYIIYLIIFFSLFFVFKYISNDNSFNTKLYILKLFFTKFKQLNIFELLFGIGTGNAEYFLKISPHIFVLSYFIETGLIGLFLILYFFRTYSISYTNTIILPVIIVGFSYFLYLGAPFLFVPLAIASNILDHYYINKSTIT